MEPARDVTLRVAFKDEPFVVKQLRKILGDKVDDDCTVGTAQELIRMQQRDENADVNLTELQFELYKAERRIDALRLERSILETTENLRSLEKVAEETSKEVNKTAAEVSKTTANVDKLIAWSKHMDDSLEDIITNAICDHINGTSSNDLRKLTDHTGRDVVEFDGVVSGTLGGENVLVLVEVKHKLRQEDIDINACHTSSQKNDCISTCFEIYQSAYEKDLSLWKDQATAGTKHLRRLKNQSLSFEGFKEENTKLVMAVGSRRFPKELVKTCEKRGYLCVIPNGDGLVVK